MDPVVEDAEIRLGRARARSRTGRRPSGTPWPSRRASRSAAKASPTHEVMPLLRILAQHPAEIGGRHLLRPCVVDAELLLGALQGDVDLVVPGLLDRRREDRRPPSASSSSARSERRGGRSRLAASTPSRNRPRRSRAVSIVPTSAAYAFCLRQAVARGGGKLKGGSALPGGLWRVSRPDRRRFGAAAGRTQRRTAARAGVRATTLPRRTTASRGGRSRTASIGSAAWSRTRSALRRPAARSLPAP